MSGARLPDDCFALPPGVDWIDVDVALSRLRAALRPVTSVETHDLDAAAGRFLAEDVVATRAHPATDNAAVDGYAFAHVAEVETLSLRLTDGRAAAGRPFRGVVAPDHALRIFTGAAMPEGADSVVLQEDVTLDAGTVSFRQPKKPGANRRRAGENVRVGDTVLAAGDRLSPQALAQAASAGVARVSIRSPLRVAILSTGDEVTPVDAAVDARPDQVVDANAPMLAAMARELGADVVSRDWAADVGADVAAGLDVAAERADVVVTSGGASGGDEDHVSRLLEERADARFHLWRVAMKPGRPIAMGLWRGKPVFGLPGNPVAAFVCFLIFVRPALRVLAGGRWPGEDGVMLPVAFDHPKKPGRREFLRVRLGVDGRLEKYRSEGSGLIEGLLWSDGLADLSHEAGPLSTGDLARYRPYRGLGLRP